MTKTITLPESLIEQRHVLEQELKKVVVELTTKNLKEDLYQFHKQYPIKSIEWDFYPESDDEGGSVYYPEGVEITFVDCELDATEVEISRTYSWSDTVYEENLEDSIRETISEYSSDLYEFDIYSIEFEVE